MRGQEGRARTRECSRHEWQNQGQVLPLLYIQTESMRRLCVREREGRRRRAH